MIDEELEKWRYFIFSSLSYRLHSTPGYTGEVHQGVVPKRRGIKSDRLMTK